MSSSKSVLAGISKKKLDRVLGRDKPKRPVARYTMEEIKSALGAVKVEVKNPFNPLFPHVKNLLDIQGIEEVFKELRRIARRKKRGKA